MTEASHLERRAIAIDRRAPAPHPGPMIARDFLAPLGYDAAVFAALIGADGAQFAAILAGSAPLDVETAVRLGRTLGLPADRLMRAQNRHDFARVRRTEAMFPAVDPAAPARLPLDAPVLRGHLARSTSAERGLALFFVTDEELTADGIDRVRAVTVGDRLRVFARDGEPLWAGPVLRDLDGRPLFAFVPARRWETWFADGLRAEFAAKP